MEQGLHVNKYRVNAVFRERVVEWSFAVETEGGERYELPVFDGAEIPVLLELVRRDQTIYFDPRGRTLSTGWSDPGRSA